MSKASHVVERRRALLQQQRSAEGAAGARSGADRENRCFLTDSLVGVTDL